MEVDVEKVALKYALANAVRFGGKAEVKAVVSKVFAELPELRTRAREIVAVVTDVVSRVNNMTLEEQEKLLRETWPEALVREKRVEEERKLPPLPRVEEFNGFVVTRFAPNPDFVLHLGSARPAILNYYYAKVMYKGKFILRFEDTDPKTKKPMLEAYDMIREDLKWLGVKWDEEYIQSLRMPIYYEHARKLIETGGAYVCTHPRDEIKRIRDEGRPDPCSLLPPETHLERWEKMLAGEYGEEQAVLRIKTDPAHPNPSVRDWIAFRVLDTSKNPHPLVGDKYTVWPTYNFACAIDDHLMGITHILRGEEHAVNTIKQEYIYRHFGWKPPVGIHFGRLNLEGMILSKSVIRRGIEKGAYHGWDDIRLGTLIALRRRGILPQTIWDLVFEVGIKPSTATLSTEKIHALNKKYLEPISNRYMFVAEPVKEYVLSGVTLPVVAEVMVHPSYPERGRRKIILESPHILVEEGALAGKGEVRLMGLGNFMIGEEGRLEFLNNDVAYAKDHGLPIIQWVPKDDNFPGTILKAERTEVRVIKGYGEPATRELKSEDRVQFVRIGFIRVEKPGVYIFTHD
ncbi:MAG: glutamate--tRNA ligase [Infirmifilum sp.]|jgi:glutamyl-tRNA synthetase|uniref:Glutamate--tRNA ligase n=1 Tax=Infirmifilum uzonense TaxID=1550241 RepID=A0A0F7FJY9_9CREN|nr:glutamate--tRNA ligase [Infirmifilum uzonense]AKG39390.1 glutamyl-tRNA synthetase [Infirmifilum uzonense]